MEISGGVLGFFLGFFLGGVWVFKVTHKNKLQKSAYFVGHKNTLVPIGKPLPEGRNEITKSWAYCDLIPPQSQLDQSLPTPNAHF